MFIRKKMLHVLTNTLRPVNYLGSPLGYIVDIIGGLYTGLPITPKSFFLKKSLFELDHG